MASRDLEKEYDPREWTTRFGSAKELLDNHVEFGNKVSDGNRYAINCLLNFPYGDSFRQRLDIYGVNLPTDAPIIVYVHGGYWQGMNKHTSSYAVKPYVEHQAKVFVIDHDLCPDVPLTEVIKQFQKAAERIFNYAVEHNSKSVSFIGHLSGAHLITYLFTDEMIKRLGDKFKLIKNIYLISGVYDLSELKNTKVVNRDNLLSITDANVGELSPMKHNFDHLKGHNIVFDAFVGSVESPTLQKQTREFVAHLKLAKLHANFHLMDGLDHFNIVEKLSEINYDITQTIIKNLA
ncbi:CLUMA_CG019545, isoform A [Clunio marinus]|uniref:CLUMA_CG019545, isoform A n=1 Tax=Clunio marinus TaxID=568069 RepID=A0A1J1J319_9DIPT|nr:CLUMA_CG019545, isoform A [Clunio marinus]